MLSNQGPSWRQRGRPQPEPAQKAGPWGRKQTGLRGAADAGPETQQT